MGIERVVVQGKGEAREGASPLVQVPNFLNLDPKEEKSLHMPRLSSHGGYQVTREPSQLYISHGVTHPMVGNMVPTMTRPIAIT